MALALELLSRFAGWFSFGCSLWSAMPQIFLLGQLPATGGPTFSLLICWLLGDAALVAGMYLTHAPITQKFSGIWFGIGDIIIMILMLVGRSSAGKRVRRRKESRDRRQAGRHESPGEAGTRRRWWTESNGWQLNALVGAMILCGSIAVWYAKDYRTKESSESSASKAPAGFLAWFGWSSGFTGLLLYNIPRWRQIYKIRKSRSMENISPWMFAWLLLQNITMLISILSVSHAPSAAFGQAPFIANAFLALVADICILEMHRKYNATRGHQVPEPTQAGLLAKSDEDSLPLLDFGADLQQSHATAQLELRLKTLREDWAHSINAERAFFDNRNHFPFVHLHRQSLGLCGRNSRTADARSRHHPFAFHQRE